MGEATENDKFKFVQDNAEAIIPVTGKDEEIKKFLDRIQNEPEELEREQGTDQAVTKAIELFKTKVFTLEKPADSYEPGAKRILMSVSDPLQYGTVSKLLAELGKDPRCSGLILFADNVAGMYAEEFLDLHKDIYKSEKLPEDDGETAEGSVFATLLKAIENKPIDIAISNLESKDSPSGSVLYAAKENFGAKKSIYICDGWNGIGQRRALFENADNMDSVDAILCADEFARTILTSQLPEKLKSKVIITGSPTLDLVRSLDAIEFSKKGREKLGIKETDIVTIFLGDVTSDLIKLEFPASENINLETLKRSVDALWQVAANHPGRKYVMLVRAHPRDGKKDKLLDVSSFTNLPPNLTIQTAMNDKIPMQEAVFASDVILAICSTENFLAPVRGRQSVFLGYQGDGLGENVLKSTFGQEYKTMLGGKEGITIAHSPDNLAKVIDGIPRGSLPVINKQENKNDTASIQTMVDEIFRD